MTNEILTTLVIVGIWELLHAPLHFVPLAALYILYKKGKAK